MLSFKFVLCHVLPKPNKYCKSLRTFAQWERPFQDTSDGRVIFLLPWQKHTIAGTTDSPCQVTESKL